MKSKKNKFLYMNKFSKKEKIFVLERAIKRINVSLDIGFFEKRSFLKNGYFNKKIENGCFIKSYMENDYVINIKIKNYEGKYEHYTFYKSDFQIKLLKVVTDTPEKELFFFKESKGNIYDEYLDREYWYIGVLPITRQNYNEIINKYIRPI